MEGVMHVEFASSGTQVQSLLDAAAQKCGRQQCEEAIGLLEEAIRIQPGNAGLYYQIGFCHSGGCRHHRFVHPDMAVEYLFHALSQAGAATEPLLRAMILDALGNLRGRRTSDAVALREAIACHEEAAEIYRLSGELDDWAREEFNQANIWCDLPEAEFSEKWTEAIKHYENALRVRTSTSDPERYAATVMNFGTALRQARSGDKAVNVMKAVRCYRAALRVYTIQKFPNRFAEACNNLGNACLTYPAEDESSRTRHARYALQHFERALKVWKRETDPYHYALAQYNRGCVCIQSATSPEHMEKALACFTDALECARSCGQAEVERLARAQLESFILTVNRPGPPVGEPRVGSRPSVLSQTFVHKVAGLCPG
jgi:tetratricopeptide (TPR) repeat protein